MVTSQGFTLPEVSDLEVHEGQRVSGVLEGHLVQIGNNEFLHRIACKTPNRYTNEKHMALSNESNAVIFICVNSNPNPNPDPNPNHLCVLCGLALTISLRRKVVLLDN